MFSYSQHRAIVRARVDAKDIISQEEDFYAEEGYERYTMWGRYNQDDLDPFDPYWDEVDWWEEYKKEKK
jgi:hypothetical protein